MKVKLISYANKPYYKSQQELKKTSMLFGVDEVVDYNDIWLRKQTGFYNQNKSILNQKKGGGFWLWKPYIVLNTLKKMANDDILIHIDSGTRFVNPIGDIVKLLNEKEILLFYNNGLKNSTWSKRDCFVYMDCDTEKYYNASQLLAGYVFCRKTPFVINLLEEWLHYAQDERIITDMPNICGLENIEGFREHRHDQSILSNLAIKYNIELFRDPSQWGNKYKLTKFRQEGEFVENNEYVDGLLTNSTYPTILDSHRTKMKLGIKDHIDYFMLNFKNYN